MRILQSTIEKGLYVLLFFMFILIVIEVSVAIEVYQKVNQQQTIIEQGVRNIEEEDNCLAAFFLQSNRLNINIANLKQCQPIVKKIN